MSSITATARTPESAGPRSKAPAVSSDLVSVLLASGYEDIRALADQVCAVKRFNFTTAVVVGLDDVGYQRRYCYEHQDVARAALPAWDGREHPPGPWIKCKGAGIDLLNPAFC
jgi:hypothetical protein